MTGVLSAAADRAWREAAGAWRAVRRAGVSQPPGLGRGASVVSADDVGERAARQAAYRAAVAPVAEPVEVVCVTMREQFLDNVVANVARQQHPVAVAIALHGFRLDADAVRERFSAAGLKVPVRVVDGSQLATLGDCLNAAISSSEHQYVAKFDDDDHYGALYLADAMRAHAYAGAGVVGKHTHFAWLPDSDSVWLRHGGREFRSTGTLAGGTFVIDRSRTSGIEFPSVNLGEDRGFLARCHRRLVVTYSADCFNYAHRRHAGNTWDVSEGAYLAGATRVGAGPPERHTDV